MARARKNKSARKINFQDEVKYFEPDEDVELVIKKATWEDGNEYPYIAIEFGGVDDYEDATLFHNASTSPKSLHRLRALLEALGMEVPEGEMDIDTDELVDMRCMGHTYEDRFKGDDGKERASVKVDDFWPIEEEEKSSKKSSKKDDKPEKGKKSKKEPEKLDRDEVEKMDRDELVELIEEHELEVDPKSRKLKKDDDALLEAVIEALEEKELLEEVEEEKPAKGKKAAAGKKGKKAETWAEDAIQEMSEEELEEVIEKAEIEVDLDEHRTLRKKKNAVIDALKEADKLEE